ISWGSEMGGLHAFVNMKFMDQYTIFDGQPLTDPRSMHYPILGQEFAHRWLAYLAYTDGGGAKSLAMLGRDQAHWASTLDADASVMDGQRWVDDGDGTFTDVEAQSRYSSLDLYAMGLLAPSEVPPWFRIAGAVDARTGAPIDPQLVGAV